MRIMLATAVALAPLMAAAGAQAQVVISNERTTPIATATATGTTADNIRIANGGTIRLTTGSAVTLNSSHSVDLDSGSNITMENTADGSVGILANGGNTGSIIVGGIIRLTDSIIAPSDTDSDGDLDGPAAAGTNRYGLRVTGAAPLVGDILVERLGSIRAEGNSSYGISVEAGLTGNLRAFGTVSVLGANSAGVRVTGDVSGQVMLGGAILASGENAIGALIEGDVGGRLTVQNQVSTTGYRLTARPNAAAIALLDADDLLQGGPAVVVAGNVAGGVLLDIRPADLVPADLDEDDDGTADAEEGQADIESFGGAPAVLVGSTTRAISLGAVGAGDAAYGFINRGSVSADGVYDNIDARAVQIGGTGQTVTLAGGFRNEGAVNANSAEASATVVQIGAGATVPTLSNTGQIVAVAITDQAADGAIGVLVQTGASVSSITNDGIISATLGGERGEAVAIRDLSGTVTSILNTGSITSFVVPTDNSTDTDDANNDPSDEVITAQAVAIDVSANTTGVTVLHMGVNDGDDDGNPATVDPDSDGDGVDDSDEPVILGNIRFGSGADTLDARNGSITGDIAFGAGADNLDISGGAVVRGALSDSDGLLDINVASGTLDARQGSVLTVSNLTIGAAGDLVVTLDPANGTGGGFNVTGTATLANGAGLGVRFTSLIQNPTRFTIIDANTLNFGAIDVGSLDQNSPYLFVVAAGADVPAGDVFVDVRRRTAAEADLIPVEAAAFDAIYSALGDNAVLREVFLSQTGREGFINLYEQMLPDHSGGPLLSLASGVDAVTRALTGRNQTAAVGQTSAWVQEINFYADKDKTDSYGFRSEGFGVAGGIERGTELGALGISLAFTSSDLQDPESEAEEVVSASLVELGLYWRAQGQYWTTWARAAGGYATFDATRQLVGGGLQLRNESSWHGYTLAAAGGASYERSYGRLTIRPEAYAEYFMLSEDARIESGGGDGFDLDIDSRDGHLLAAVAAVNFGLNMGADNWLRPEIRVGWRQNISVDPGDTIARFVSGGPEFRLSPETIEGGGPMLGFRLNIGNQLGLLTIEGDAEMIEDYVRYSLLLRASFRF